MRPSVSWSQCIAGLIATLAFAAPAAAGQRWEIEAHGGALMSSNPGAGDSALPPASAPVPVVPSIPPLTVQPVASWYFGDGAAYLNAAVPIRLSAGIVPLDSTLTGRFVERESGGSFGVRVARSVSPRFGVEVSVDRGNGQLAVLPAVKGRITASEASFLSTWNAVLNAVSNGTQTVATDATIAGNRGTQLITTGAVLINLLQRENLTPYVAVGAGYAKANGQPPTVTVTGNYGFVVFPQLQTLPPLQVDQTDTVTIRTSTDNTVTWLAGGGVKYAISNRWGVRADVRDHLNRDVVRTTVSATPTSVSPQGVGALSLIFLTGQTLVFSSSPTIRSTLSATVNNFTTFHGTGLVNQVNASAGIFWRF